MQIIELAGEHAGFFITLSTILGLLVGSFLNVVIYRVPVMMQNSWHRDCCDLLEVENPKKQTTPFNLVTPGSRCQECGTPIRAWQNIPVVSYLLLRGRCAHCSTPISIRYPIIELVSGLMTGYLAFALGFGGATVAAMLFTWVLIALTMIDVDHQLLPDNMTLPLLWLGLALNSTANGITDLHSAVYGAIAGYLVLWTVFWLFKLVTGKEGMGFGDFKLLAALGAWMGWQSLPLIIILSSFVGAVIGIAGIMIMGRDKNIPIPFGPYLAIAGWIALLWGDQITASYLQFAGLQ